MAEIVRPDYRRRETPRRRARATRRRLFDTPIPVTLILCVSLAIALYAMGPRGMLGPRGDAPLSVLDSPQIRVVDDDTVRFDQDAADGVRPILHMALFHPLNDHYGMSPLEPGATGIDLHNAAGAWNKALLDNSACPSGALVYTAKDGQLTPEQYERLKSELEESFQGAKNAGRPLLLEGGLDWKAMAFSPKDMDFIAAKHVAAREVALALGVPPMLLGIPGDNTYSNYAEANRSFWRQTILPLVNRTAKALSGWLAPGFAGAAGPIAASSLELRPDLDSVEALSTEREALWERVRASDFLTVNEKRAAVGYGAIEGGDALVPAPQQ